MSGDKPDRELTIIGGGPAGCSAAIEACKHGSNDVVVLEKGTERMDRDGPGADSTDAAGMLDYWVDLMDISEEELSDLPILQELDCAVFNGPNESVVIDDTGIESSYDGFGFTFDRVEMDDYLRDEAKSQGAEYLIGSSVRGVESTYTGGDYIHSLQLSSGEEITSKYLVLADGPQRRATIPTLEQFESKNGLINDAIGPLKNNHIAYQEYRRFPEEEFRDDAIQFWWGVIPGETAYPWFFPNKDRVMRAGLTMPMGIDLDKIENRGDYDLLRDSDESVPNGSTYISRLLDRLYGDKYDIEQDFPLVTDKGKKDGVESYPISSTNPIDSPIKAGVMVAGGAMGSTSAFHEGGYHLAVRTGKIAGELAAKNEVERYNNAWKDAIGSEITRNICLASLVREYTPGDWDRLIKYASMALRQRATSSFGLLRTYFSVLALRLRYGYIKRFKENPYTSISENEYSYG